MGILRVLDPDLVNPRAVRSLLLTQHTPEELLGDKKFRELFIDSQPVSRARELAAHVLDASPKGEQALYARLRRLSGENLSKFLTYFGVDLGARREEGSVEWPAIEPLESRYGLFSHQRRALRELKAFIPGAQGRNRVVLHLPTGAGKTRTTMRLIAEFLAKNEGKTVLWIANTEELCGQASEEFGKAWEAVGNRDIPLARIWGGVRPDDFPQEGLMVASVQSLHAIRSNPIRGTQVTAELAKRLGLMVFDEAHQVVAPTYSLVVDFIASMHDNLPVIGLTATPGRTWADIDEDKRLAEFFQGNKVKLKIDGYESPIRFLIDEGYLADPSFYSHSHEWEDAGAVAERVSRLLDADSKLLQEIGSDAGRNLLIRETLLNVASRHSRTIYFAPSVENSDAMAFLLRQRGIEAASVTGASPLAFRREALLRFKANTASPMVLCNFGILTTGFDAPMTSAAVIARPTKSLVLYSQMVGRAMRGTLAGGNAACEIHTIVDAALPGFSHPIAAFENWEDVWKD